MQHEILYLNENRIYVRVNETWYDTNKDLEPRVGAPFLLGKISEVMSYESYKNLYPGSTEEIYESVNESITKGGYIRAAITKKLSRFTWAKIVKYGIIQQSKKDIDSKGQSEE